MKKIIAVIVLTLAINFIAAAGAVGWLFKNGNVNRERLMAIKEIVFPKPVEEAPPSTQPSADPTTQPTLQLEELLAKVSGRSASEQIEFIQSSFRQQLAEIDKRERDVRNLTTLLDAGRMQVAKDRAALDARDKALAAKEQAATRLASDKGFQDSLALYNTIPSKQVKTIFMGLDDSTIMSYLEAMQPRVASKIIKEFKTPEETDRIQKILERMRQAHSPAAAAQQASASAGPAGPNGTASASAKE